MPSRTKKRHFTIIIFMLLLLSLGALGCGGHQKQTQEPSLSFKITNAQSGPLDTVEDLVANQDFEAASQHLKAVDIGMTSVQDRDRLAYLTARIALAQHPKSGCKLLAKYAQTTTHPQRKTVATQLALRCLVAPNACSQIKAISKDLLRDLKAMEAEGLLKIRLRCPDHTEVVNALINQQHQFSPKDQLSIGGADTIISHLDGTTLKALLPRLNHSDLLEQRVRVRLLSDFLPLLSTSEQKRYVSSLSPTHPARIAWAGSTRGTQVLVCLPLTGKFASVGNTIQSQLTRLQSATPPLFAGTLTFMDCNTEAWSESLFSAKLAKFSAQFVLSLSDTRLQTRLSTLLEKTPEVTHFTLNPIYPGTITGQNTWTLNVAPDLLVGTFVNDALKRLKRSGSMPLPIHLICVTDSERHSPIKRYLKQYSSSFSGLELLSTPKPCKPDTPSRTCASQRQQQWMNLADKVSKLTNATSPFDVVYLDLNSDEAVSFLKYFANENIEVDTSGKRHNKGDTKTTPLIYSDHRPVHSSESQIEVLEQDTQPPQRVLKNRFTRLSGEYSNGLRYLVHFNPLSQTAAQFIQTTTQHLGEQLRTEVITLVEALSLIDTIVKDRRQLTQQTASGKTPVTYQGHTSGLSWSRTSRTLPRLGILITRDGYFIEQ